MIHERDFEKFLKETKDAACPGCGEVGLYEYLVVDDSAGLLKCPRCNQNVNLKQAMRSWIVKKEGTEAR